ncbi:hypothetical protein [Leptospira stimsonii]|uniref:Uncharacterized protein n=1 Tax=Leptospira stimsonii TaxID=2202203 RepID=A0ABY2N1A5_9LEPT|nr:hypothetical protein [Leptospira stimsonii]TGK19768.1 hypothetical protein EHO98_10825 [Leptospira stimsonii]TGM13766.1 hypothetical protein EHQ90_13220 [Leptospira stimsonii]
MANTTKRDRIRIRFLCDQVGHLKEKGVNPIHAFDRCWEKIPDALIQKLNAEELSLYIQRHLLPNEILNATLEKEKSQYDFKSA